MSLSRKLSSIWTASVGVSAVHETITQEGITHVYTLFALPLGVLYDSTDLSLAAARPDARAARLAQPRADAFARPA